jgi:hypothetical protein
VAALDVKLQRIGALEAKLRRTDSGQPDRPTDSLEPLQQRGVGRLELDRFTVWLEAGRFTRAVRPTR